MRRAVATGMGPVFGSRPAPSSATDRLGEALSNLLAGTKEQGGRLGRAALDLDDRYATALRDKSFVEGDILGRGDKYTTTTLRDAMANPEMQGLVAANLATRYGLPAGGVTMAGIGIADLINALRGPAVEDDVASVRLVLDQ